MCTDKSMDILPEFSSVSRRKMITKKEILDAIHGKMIISCQAVEDEPLYVEEKSIMYLMARAAKQAGTPAIRTSSIRDVIAIKEETGLPVIGLVRIQYPGYEGYFNFFNIGAYAHSGRPARENGAIYAKQEGSYLRLLTSGI